MNIVIATIKSWNIENAILLQKKYKGIHQISIITDRNELSIKNLTDLDPTYIFFPHWSHIISSDIYNKFNCILFHMTDLPFGRGGSPLQNLIVRGLTETRISAIKVVREIDAGPIYMKKPLLLNGSADEILREASKIIFMDMIPEIINKELSPTTQEGRIVAFKRRKPSDSELDFNISPSQLYDYIRMLDAEGYPNAFVKLENYKLFFTQAHIKDDIITAKVVIRRCLDE
jgi:methionyl-tRNA formyltransferase